MDKEKPHKGYVYIFDRQQAMVLRFGQSQLLGWEYQSPQPLLTNGQWSQKHKSTLAGIRARTSLPTLIKWTVDVLKICMILAEDSGAAQKLSGDFSQLSWMFLVLHVISADMHRHTHKEVPPSCC